MKVRAKARWVSRCSVLWFYTVIIWINFDSIEINVAVKELPIIVSIYSSFKKLFTIKQSWQWDKIASSIKFRQSKFPATGSNERTWSRMNWGESKCIRRFDIIWWTCSTLVLELPFNHVCCFFQNLCIQWVGKAVEKSSWKACQTVISLST